MIYRIIFEKKSRKKNEEDEEEDTCAGKPGKIALVNCDVTFHYCKGNGRRHKHTHTHKGGERMK
jgi:hypothetical protein